MKRAWETPLPQWRIAAVRSARVMLLDPQNNTEEAGNFRHISNAVFLSAEDSRNCSASASGLRLQGKHSTVSGHSMRGWGWGAAPG